MFILYVLGIAGVIVAGIVVYLFGEVLVLNASIWKDEKAYIKRKHEILDDITFHLKNLKNEHNHSTDFDSESHKRKIKALESFIRYLQR